MTGNVRKFALLIAMVVIGWAAGLFLQSQRPLAIDVSGNRVAQAAQADRALPGEGPAEADLRVIVYSDYQCPVCRLTEPALLAAARADGKTRIVYREIPIFGKNSDHAARVALAADGQGKYLAVRRALLQEEGALDPERIRAIVTAAGADWGKIVAELSSPAVERALAAARKEAFAFNLPGTPAYLVGNQLAIGRRSEAEFRKLFAMARRTGSLPPVM